VIPGVVTSLLQADQTVTGNLHVSDRDGQYSVEAYADINHCPTQGGRHAVPVPPDIDVAIYIRGC
jgi:hypothetical protein